MPITKKQAALTKRFLIPAQTAIFDYLMALRNEMDPVLSARYPNRFGKTYPLGCCLEITQDVMAELNRRVQKPTAPALRAIHAFVSAGGIVRPIWGVLRGVFFQNAMQFGSLYIDVSNDTVTVTKPKIEILPLAESGLEAIRDLDHFADAAGKYWNAEIFANHALPGLAPFMPMIAIYKTGEPSLQSPTDYMLALMIVDRFKMAESWLRDRPPPPQAVLDAYRAAAPAHLLPPPGIDAQAAAIRSCQDLRSLSQTDLLTLRNARVDDYLSLLPRVRHLP